LSPAYETVSKGLQVAKIECWHVLI
jgi:hypothetical protein